MLTVTVAAGYVAAILAAVGLVYAAIALFLRGVR
jgi:hypothetical protein